MYHKYSNIFKIIILIISFNDLCKSKKDRKFKFTKFYNQKPHELNKNNKYT